MSPSVSQSGNADEWDTKEDRFIESDMDIVPLLRGADTEEQRRAWIGAMNRADKVFSDEMYEIVVE